MARSQRVRVEELIRRMEPSIARAFRQAIDDAALSVDRAALIRLLEAGRIEEAVQLLRLNQSVMFPMTEAIRAAYFAGAASLAAPRGLSGVFRFDGSQPEAQRWVQEKAATLIQGITEEATDMARTVLQQAGQVPSRKLATEITGRAVGGKRVGGFLGLNAQQADSIIRGRAALASGDAVAMREYLGLKLRDRRFDGAIRRAIREGRAITGTELDRIMEAHRTKALGYRGRVIARNEANNALAAGRDDAYRQILARPDVRAVTKRWQHNLSEYPRLEHQAMDGTVIGFNELFQFPDAAMKHPHDPAGGARHTIGCRCIAIYRVEFERG
jgi:hypothetical protein